MEGTALLGLRAAREVGVRGKAGIELDESGFALLFLLDGDRVRVLCTLTERVARTRHAALLQTWDAFAEDVLRSLRCWRPDDAGAYAEALRRARTDPAGTPASNVWEWYAADYLGHFQRLDADEA